MGLDEHKNRQPEKSLLFKTVQEHWLSFKAMFESSTHSLPKYVCQEFEAFLRCGIWAYGFLRLKCDTCSAAKAVAFCCKKRGFCPSCGGRRMAEYAAHLTDAVLPKVPLRQWVISVPIPLRYWMNTNPKLQSQVLKIITTVIGKYYRKSTSMQNMSAAVTLVQRFGSSLNLNLHFHILFTEGTFDKQAKFSGSPGPSDEQTLEILKTIRNKVIVLLKKQNLIPQNDDEAPPESYEDNLIDQLNAGSITHTIVLGERAGQKVERQGHNYWGSEPQFVAIKAPKCVYVSGFSLHANTHLRANDDKGRERLCRYITRPPLSLERLDEFQGKLRYKLKTPWADKTTHLVFKPLVLIEKLVALIPRPRIHLLIYHGALSPNAKIRSKIIPQPEKVEPKVDIVKKGRGKGKKKYYTWAELLKRVFEIDVTKCLCGGTLKIKEAILDTETMREVLGELGIGLSPPPQFFASTFRSNTNFDFA